MLDVQGIDAVGAGDADAAAEVLHGVLAEALQECRSVLPQISDDDVVAEPAGDRVVAATAEEPVRTAVAGQHVVECRAEQAFDRMVAVAVRMAGIRARIVQAGGHPDRRREVAGGVEPVSAPQRVRTFPTFEYVVSVQAGEELIDPVVDAHDVVDAGRAFDLAEKGVVRQPDGIAGAVRSRALPDVGDPAAAHVNDRGGPAYLNRISASLSGACAGIMLPSGGAAG